MTGARAPQFNPPRWLRSPHLQSILHGLTPLAALGRLRARAVLRAQQEWQIDCGDDVKLQSFHSPAVHPRGRLAVLLHGWEGSARSAYVLSLAAVLYAKGYSVLRINLRDHGGTQGLNRDIFHSCRLSEVVGALRAVAARWPQERLFLAGFSLGGNFMLRAAADPGVADLPVARVVAISPVLHPASTLAAMEEGWTIYERYFIHRWGNNLRRKQLAWPGAHDFTPAWSSKTLRAMTASMVGHTPYSDIHTYLDNYAITGERLVPLRFQSDVLLAADDPIIPAHDVSRLADNELLNVTVTAHGGHCGFIEKAGRSSFADRFALGRFEASS